MVFVFITVVYWCYYLSPACVIPIGNELHNLAKSRLRLCILGDKADYLKAGLIYFYNTSGFFFFITLIYLIDANYTENSFIILH